MIVTMKNMETPEVPVEIPLDALSPEALAGIIDNFILREGTDYGSVEVSHETKIRQVQKQLERGEVKIAYEASSESVSLLTLRDWQKLARD